MTGYDPDERTHSPTPSFLSRRPTSTERRRLRRVLAALPPPPTLIFWPESGRIDGPWFAGPTAGLWSRARGSVYGRRRAGSRG